MHACSYAACKHIDGRKTHVLNLCDIQIYKTPNDKKENVLKEIYTNQIKYFTTKSTKIKFKSNITLNYYNSEISLYFLNAITSTPEIYFGEI